VRGRALLDGGMLALMAAASVLTAPGVALARMKSGEQQAALAIAAALLKRPLYAPLIYTGRYGLEGSVAIGLTKHRGKRKPRTNLIAGISPNTYYLGVVREDPGRGVWATFGVATEQEKPRSAMLYGGLVFRLFKW